MMLAILFEIPDDKADEYAALAGQLIEHHRFAALHDLPVWSFNAHMRPLAAAMQADADTAVKALAATLPQ